MSAMGQMHQETYQNYCAWLSAGQITETEFRKQMKSLGFDDYRISCEITAIYDRDTTIPVVPKARS